VRILQGDVMARALDDGSMDAVVSQEAFLHSSTKRALEAALLECALARSVLRVKLSS
jgi:hypothetical protein